MRDVSRAGFVDQLVSKLLAMDNGFKLDGFTLRTIYLSIYLFIYLYIYIYMRVYIYIYRLKAGGSPELPGTLSLEPILQTSLWYRDGGWGGGGV